MKPIPRTKRDARPGTCSFSSEVPANSKEWLQELAGVCKTGSRS
jgi:hypothetical protein